MVGFVGAVLEFLLGDVLFGEVPEAGVGVFGGVIVLPGFVVLVGLLVDNAFQLILACLRRELHWRWEAGLSLRSDCAKELCCSLGSMSEVIKIKLYKGEGFLIPDLVERGWVGGPGGWLMK